MQRTLFEADHEAYRATVREFFDREVAPNLDVWDRDRMIDRSVFRTAAKHGIFGLEIPEEFGGAGVQDYRYRLIVCEEAARVQATAFNVTLGLFDDIVTGYLLDLTTDEQKQRWLPAMAAGELVAAIGMTEPGTGSDLRGIRTTAVRDGNEWIINGSKTFISSGITADLVIVAARTGDGFSLFAVDADTPGFVRGRKLEKVGLHAQDTAELFFENVRVPAENLIGTEGKALAHMMAKLSRERLGIIAMSQPLAQAIFELTHKYCFERTAFGSPIGDFQATRFTLAEMVTELDVSQAYVDTVVREFNAGRLTAVDAAKGKWYVSELLKRTVDQCLQLHGGYGYMLEYPVARAFVDSRVLTIFGGTTEVMKELIGRDLAASA